MKKKNENDRLILVDFLKMKILEIKDKKHYKMKKILILVDFLKMKILEEIDN